MTLEIYLGWNIQHFLTQIAVLIHEKFYVWFLRAVFYKARYIMYRKPTIFSILEQWSYMNFFIPFSYNDIIKTEKNSHRELSHIYFDTLKFRRGTNWYLAGRFHNFWILTQLWWGIQPPSILSSLISISRNIGRFLNSFDQVVIYFSLNLDNFLGLRSPNLVILWCDVH